MIGDYDDSETVAPNRGDATVHPGVESWSAPTLVAERVAAIRDAVGVGSIVKQRFELCEEIGHGGMGVVFSARDLRRVEARDPDPFIAIKFLSEELAGIEQGFMALQREAKHAQDLNHPNIVKHYCPV